MKERNMRSVPESDLSEDTEDQEAMMRDGE